MTTLYVILALVGAALLTAGAVHVMNERWDKRRNKIALERHEKMLRIIRGEDDE
ncbi:hypothetical protein [Mycobacterium phage WXIN]|nr:hypothetical protein [Mycobacterium phage WXIN]